MPSIWRNWAHCCTESCRSGRTAADLRGTASAPGAAGWTDPHENYPTSAATRPAGATLARGLSHSPPRAPSGLSHGRTACPRSGDRAASASGRGLGRVGTSPDEHQGIGLMTASWLLVATVNFSTCDTPSKSPLMLAWYRASSRVVKKKDTAILVMRDIPVYAISSILLLSLPYVTTRRSNGITNICFIRASRVRSRSLPVPASCSQLPGPASSTSACSIPTTHAADADPFG